MQTQRLPVKLTQEEIKLRGQQMAGLEDKFEDVQSISKQVSKTYKDELEGLRGEILRLTKQINSGNEYRDVQIEERKDWTSQEVLTYRCDTYEITDRRPMTSQELSRGQNLFEDRDGESEFERHIERVTLSSGDKTVTLTGEQFDQAAETLTKAA